MQGKSQEMSKYHRELENDGGLYNASKQGGTDSSTQGIRKSVRGKGEVSVESHNQVPNEAKNKGGH